MDKKLLAPEDIEMAFVGTNFGHCKNEDVIKWSLLKVASGYATGHTAMKILQLLGLLHSYSKKPVLTKRGQSCLWEFFKSGYKGE
jgi:hypothetical protein